VLCEISAHGNFITTWLAVSMIALTFSAVMSALLFRRYYWRPSFERWQRKSNPEYPAPAMVRREALQMVKGIAVAALPPTISLALVSSGWSKAYCGVGEMGVGYLVLSFFIVWIGSDFVEFYYHRMGHIFKFAWKEHKSHHVFHNPSPFAVIADGYADQFFRALPMLIFPLLMPVNIDLLFFTFAAFFYAYGVYLHMGYEVRWPDAHHPWLNTSFQHYIHHARSTYGRPYHTGFFFKLWDRLFNSLYEDECVCAKCAVARGERTREVWEKIEKPDYSVLLESGFWWSTPRRTDSPARSA